MVAVKREQIKIGDILKRERLHLGLTREQVAERAEITARYLTAIENNEKKPLIDVLHRLIHGIGISADLIFYPERAPEAMDKRARLVRLLDSCEGRDIDAICAMAESLIDSRVRERRGQSELNEK